jgi:hypothetical protein
MLNFIIKSAIFVNAVNVIGVNNIIIGAKVIYDNILLLFT